MSKQPLIKFTVLLSASLLIVFYLHLGYNYLSDNYLYSNKIIESYFLNFFMAFISYLVLFFSIKKYVSSLGFIFMITSVVKFLVFYILFHSHYSLNENIDLQEFLTIMIPYSTSIINEIHALSKILKD